MMRDGSSGSFRIHDWLNWDISGSYGCGGCGRDVDWASSGSYDPIDLLPSDPFEMNMGTTLSEMDLGTTISAIAGWIEVSNDDHRVDGDDLVAGLSYYWNNTFLSSFETRLNCGSSFVDFCNESFSGSAFDVTGDDRCGAVVAAEEVVTAEEVVAAEEVSISGRGEAIHTGGDESLLHEGLLLSLGYLGVQDLLSVERVCRSLRYAVQNDSLLWRCIHIDSPSSDKITDNDLYFLTLRAQGSMQCLCLARCSRITDDGLKRVLCSNPRLKKLSIPGCLGLTAEGLINNLKALKLLGMPGIKSLKLGRLFIASSEQFEELRSLVGADESKAHKLQFYHNSIPSIACDDDRAIDIEMCPLCHNYRLVFDCPSESCRGTELKHCRACVACIARCVQCGRCINDCKYMETFCLDNVCSGCWKQPSPNEDTFEEK